MLLAPLAERQSLGIIGATDTVVFGRSGEGPGEFRQVLMATTDDGDSLVVLSAGRIDKFTPDLRFIRSERTIPQLSAVLNLGQGRFVLTAYRAPGQPFLLVGDDLAPIRWLGDPHLDSDSLEHHVARDGAGGFWAAQTLPPHRVVHYRGDSLVASEWMQPAEWAASAVASNKGRDPLAVRPAPRLTSIWADPARQLLWFTFTVADAQWRPRAALLSAERERGMTRYDGVPRDELFDGLIEVRRIANGALVTSRRLPLPPSGITPDGTLYGMHEAEDGTLSMRVWRLSLNGEVQ